MLPGHHWTDVIKRARQGDPSGLVYRLRRYVRSHGHPDDHDDLVHDTIVEHYQDLTAGATARPDRVARRLLTTLGRRRTAAIRRRQNIVGLKDQDHTVEMESDLLQQLDPSEATMLKEIVLDTLRGIFERAELPPKYHDLLVRKLSLEDEAFPLHRPEGWGLKEQTERTEANRALRRARILIARDIGRRLLAERNPEKRQHCKLILRRLRGGYYR